MAQPRKDTILIGVKSLKAIGATAFGLFYRRWYFFQQGINYLL
jgi:hypothetical protein